MKAGRPDNLEKNHPIFWKEAKTAVMLNNAKTQTIF